MGFFYENVPGATAKAANSGVQGTDGITAEMLACAGTGTQLDWADAVWQMLATGGDLPQSWAVNNVVLLPRVPNVWVTPKELMCLSIGSIGGKPPH